VEAEVGVFQELLEAPLLKTDIVGVVHVVDANHGVALFEQ